MITKGNQQKFERFQTAVNNTLKLRQNVVYAGEDARLVKKDHYRPSDSEYNAGGSAQEVVQWVEGI
jgi:hypothetical protein